MKNLPIIIVTAIITAALIYFFTLNNENRGIKVSQSYQTKEGAYDRVLRTGKIRCGYFIEYPFTFQNLENGQLEGIIPDLMNVISEDTGLEVIWAEEMNASTMIEGLNTKRYDALCAGIMVLASRAHLMQHSVPFIYTPLFAYVRKEDNRFDNDIFKANNSKYKIIGLDGSGKTLLALKAFKNANISLLPQFSSFAELFINVADKKADMTFTIPAEFQKYNESNPNKLKQVGLFETIPIGFCYQKNETSLKNMFDTLFVTYISDGTLDKIIDKWEDYPDSFYRAAKPFEAGEGR